MARAVCAVSAALLLVSVLVSLGFSGALVSWSDLLSRLTERAMPLQALGAAMGLLVFAILPLPYTLRAVGLVALGTTLVVEGCLGEGPLGALLLWPTSSYPWELARLVAAFPRTDSALDH